MKRSVFFLIAMVFWTSFALAEYKVRHLAGGSDQRRVVFESFLNPT